MAPLKVFVASATANPETKYRVQRTLMILDGLGIPFDAIDITKPEHAEQRMFMKQNATKKCSNGAVLPPQFFYDDEYLGDYEDFDVSVEEDTITEFLRLLPDVIESNATIVSAEEKSVAEELTVKPKENSEDEEEEDEEWDEDEEEADEEIEEQKTEKLAPPKETPPVEKVEADEEELEPEDEEYDEDEE
uniref:Glutaredoxin domain-containing protein n=1 Tax=Caenorhabditis japonica TaxID=281687 RepID=A0A8R1DS87_CAEJA